MTSKSNDLSLEIREGQSIELLKALHILTVDGKLNADSRRKLKQVYHLIQFVELSLKELLATGQEIHIADMGAGKSYLGFLLYDLFLKDQPQAKLWCVESRPELVETAKNLALKMGFDRVHYIQSTIADAGSKTQWPEKIHMTLALHACDTATDEAMDFALDHQASHLLLVPCCQAETAEKLKALPSPMKELWSHPIHRREFGSHLTNVFRSLKLEASGYKVRATEFTGWEHTLKNELILAVKTQNESYRPEALKKWKSLFEQFPANPRFTPPV